MKRIFSILLVGVLLFSVGSTAFAAAEAWQNAAYSKAEKAIQDTAAYLLKEVPNPEIGSVGGEWSIIGLKTSGVPVPEAYYEAYYQRVVNTMKAQQGNLTQNKYTEYSRLILALTAMGKDVTNVGGYNLLEKLADMENIRKQGINGPIYALLALDSHQYDLPKVAGVVTPVTRQGLIEYILDQEITSVTGIKGGFSLSGGTVADADVTGMALQALAKYKGQPAVKEAIDRALKVLEGMEQADGTFSSWGTQTSESIVQVIVAKTALGEDATKNVAGLLTYHTSGQGFEHVLGAGENVLATEQSLYALAAYKLQISEGRRLYDFNHVTIAKENTNQIRVTLDGVPLTFDQPPVNINGRVLVPMRSIFEALGAVVTWDGVQREVTGTLEGKVIRLRIGNTEASLNGKPVILDVPAQIINSRTLVPVRFISESLGTKVEWDQQGQTVRITRL